MNFLRKLYPGAFALEKKVTKPFVTRLVIYVVIGIVFAVISAIINIVFAAIGNEALSVAVGALVSIISSLLSIYLTGGIVISILKFVGVIKDPEA